MNTFTPLWSMVVNSSLWDESDVVCKVFMTMLALKDMDHVYRGSAYNLSKQSRKSEIEVLDAWKVLSSPDTKRIEKQEHGGRRIKAVDGGWLILNGEKYQELMQTEMRLARLRRAQAAWRRRKKEKENALPKQHPSPGENAYVAAANNGDEQRMDKLTEPRVSGNGYTD